MTSQETSYTQRCPTCGRRLRFPVRYLGMALTCQHCRGVFIARDSSSIWDEQDLPSKRKVDGVIKQLEEDIENSKILVKI